jgi:hypothetical protein
MNQVGILSRLVTYSVAVRALQRGIMLCVFFLAEPPFFPYIFLCSGSNAGETEINLNCV